MRKIMLIILLVWVSISVGLAQDDDLGLTLVDVQLAADFVDNHQHTAILSPDGRWLAMEGNGGTERGICLYDLDADGASSCTPYPLAGANGERVQLNNPPGLRWSPDSRTIALTENALIYLYDGDIWLFDVETQTFTNRTDDGYSENILIIPDASNAPIDVSPTWGTKGELYFFRYIDTEDDPLTQLMVIPDITSDDEPLLVADYTDDADILAFYPNNSGASLQSEAAISPDGTRMAALMRPRELDQSEMWVIDLTSGDILHQIPIPTFTSSGLPEWVEDDERRGFMPEGVTWADDNRLVVNFVNPIFVGSTVGWLAYAYDLDTEAVTPIIDYSDVPSMRAYLLGEDEDGNEALYPHPRFAVLSPAGDHLIYFNGPVSPTGPQLSAIQIGSNEPTPLYTFEPNDFSLYPMNFASIGGDDERLRVAMYGYIFTFEVE